MTRRRGVLLGAIGIAVVSSLAGPIGAGPSEGDPVPRELSDDKTYGYSEKNPIKVGRLHGGPRDSELFLSSLRGPEGQQIKFKRLGSCCFFETPNAWVGGQAPLDRYELRYKGLKEPIILYLDIYDYDQPKVPYGLTKTESN